MKARPRHLLLAGALTACTVLPSSAQEPTAVLPRHIDSLLHNSMLFAPSMPLNADWIRLANDPIEQERRKVREMMRRQAQRSVLQRPEGLTTKDPNQTVGFWRLSIGNTATDNWSPFEDRALDARTLRFPLPRNMQPDKRPESQQRLDKLKK